MKPAVIESMTRISLSLGDYVIRVWRQEDKLKDEYDNEDLKIAAYSISLPSRELRKKAYYYKTIAEMMLQIDRVSAVEVTHRDGTGVVLYREWP